MLKPANFNDSEIIHQFQAKKKKLRPSRWRDVEAKQDKLNAEREQSEEAYWDSLLNGEDYNLNAV